MLESSQRAARADLPADAGGLARLCTQLHVGGSRGALANVEEGYVLVRLGFWVDPTGAPSVVDALLWRARWRGVVEAGAWYPPIVLAQLPGWIVDDVASVRAEVAEWRELTIPERWRLAVRCSRDAMWAVRSSGHPQRILDHVDPLPDSTIQALARLRGTRGHGDR